MINLQTQVANMKSKWLPPNKQHLRCIANKVSENTNSFITILIKNKLQLNQH